MEYTKQTWTAPTGTGLSRYAKSGETETHVELALDPENLTNTPTPFTMARMTHMEDGIAKAYDTAPPTPWAQYSGKDIPQLPDNLAGTIYKNSYFTTLDGGWAQNGGTPATSSFSDGEWKIISDGVSEGYTRPLPAGQIFIIDIKCLDGAVNIIVRGNILRTYAVSSNWNRFVYYNSEATAGVVMASSSGTWLVKSIYIGTGAYDRLVFDNSYHYRHLLNNAVIPTQQGLYFNGATSYLRSKDKVTLPDVFTFSATVNCAIKSTPQMFFTQGANAIATIPFIFVFRRASTDSLIVQVSNGTVITEAFSAGNFFTGLDNTDIKIEISFDFINKTTKVYRNNIQFGSVVSTPTMLKPVTDYIYLGDYVTGAGKLLGYMRNICFFDTALTDTQRNWLAQGNTPPILYDVTNYETEGYVSIQDSDGTNTGVAVSVDSNGNRILKLPATIKANVTGNADTASKANVRVSLRHGNTWFAKTWTDLTDFIGERIWTDGDNIYYSDITQQFVLNKTTATWVVKTWTGLTDFIGNFIWTDGENIYHSNGTSQLVLNKTTSTWTAKIWVGLTVIDGAFIWTDGENIYYSSGTEQFVLNKTTPTWTAKTWTGLTNFISTRIWTDGENIYYSSGTEQFVLNKTTSTWVAKTWTGLTDFNGSEVWTDGENIYYSAGTTQYVLNKATSTWVAKTWTGLTDFIAYNNWTDGENIYYSSGTNHYVLPVTRHNYVDDAKYHSLFGTVTKCLCTTLSDRFVFGNE